MTRKVTLTHLAPCKSCSRGKFVTMWGRGRSLVSGDKVLVIPNGMPVRTCDACGEMLLDGDEMKYLEDENRGF